MTLSYCIASQGIIEHVRTGGGDVRISEKFRYVNTNTIETFIVVG